MPRPTLFDHPKFHRLVHLLQLPEPYVLGHLEYLWRVGYSSGNPVIGDALDVELAAKWQGEPGVFCNAVTQVRLLDVTNDNKYVIHDLHKNAPSYVTLRNKRESERGVEKTCRVCGSLFYSAYRRGIYCSNACRQEQWRQRRQRGQFPIVTESDVFETESNSTPAPAPAPAPTLVQIASPPAEPAPKPAALMTFQTVGKAKTWDLTEDLVKVWTEAFPSLDVLEECRRAKGWVASNPAKRKTAVGMPKFLYRWMERANDRSRGRAEPGAPYAPPENLADRLRRHLGKETT